MEVVNAGTVLGGERKVSQKRTLVDVVIAVASNSKVLRVVYPMVNSSEMIHEAQSMLIHGSFISINM